MSRYALVPAILLIAAASLPPAAAQILLPNTPDPFCPPIDNHTEITFQLPASGYTTLEVCDVFDQRVRFLFGQVLAAGTHAIWWNGRDDADEFVGTGNFIIQLEFAGQVVTDPCTIFCQTDLEGPYRQQVMGIDQAAAFAVGLEQPQVVSLIFLAGDHTTVVRTIDCGLLPAGVSTHVWDLRDEGGAIVPTGIYWCRVDTPGYFEEIEFPLLTWAEPVTITWSFRDARGVVRTGGPDSLTATPIELPMLEAWAHFSRPLHSGEVEVVLSNMHALGSLTFIEPDTMLIGQDSTYFYLPSFTAEREWPDIWGIGYVDVPLSWVQNENGFFRLRYEFANITMTDPTCTPIGNVDPLDWNCPAGGLNLLPACPNPAPTPGALRVRFELPASEWVDLVIVDRQGFLVRSLVQGYMPAGAHAILWDLCDEAGVPVGEDIYRVIGVTGEDLACGGDVMVGEVTAVTEFPPPSGGANGSPSEPRAPLAELRVSPNPLRAGGTTVITWTALRTPAMPVGIFDLAGRCVRLLDAEGVPGSGLARAVWDGRDAGGKILPGGVYLARPAGAERGSGTAVVLIR